MRTDVPRVAAAIFIAALAAGCGSPGSSASAPLPGRTPGPSPVPAAAGQDPIRWIVYKAFQAGSLEVPLDYTDPSAGTIHIYIHRRPAANPASRIGALLLNPGGPGVSGAPFASWDKLDTVIPQAILDRFDVVAWDPRGVGKSWGLACPDDATLGELAVLDPSTAAQGAVDAHRAPMAALIAQCQVAAQDILPHLSEADTARDMDAIRAALGEDTISYIGWSYGSYLGYLYATMFPERLRAAVLDGPIDPHLDLADRTVGQARGADAAFERFTELCAAARDCAFHGGGDPGAAYDALVAGLRGAPGGRPLTASRAVAGTLMGLWGHDYPGLAAALAAAEQGDGAELRGAADRWYTAPSLGSYYATNCVDNRHPTTVDSAAEAVEAADGASPRFGSFIALFDPVACLDWPVPAAQVPVSDPPPGLPPILVVAGRWDPATPLAWAEPLADALGSGVVLTRDGVGHLSGESATRNPCLRAALEAYLVDLRPPAAGTVCEDEPVSFGP